MALILAYRSHKGQNVAFQGSVAPMLNWYHSGECCGAGRLRSSGSGVGSTVSGRTGKPGRTRKAYYTRIPCYITSSCARSRVHKLRRRNGCRLDPVHQHLPQKGNKRTIGYGCKAGKRYKYLSDADPKNAFDMEKHLKRRPAIVKPDEVFDYYELDAADLQEDADHEET